MLTTVALGACDNPALTRPGGPLAPRQWVSAPEAIGSSTLDANDQSWHQVGGDIPSFTWVLAEASGSVSARLNPDCANEPPNWPCNTSPLVPDFSSEPSTQGPVQLLALVGARYAAVAIRGDAGGGVGLYQARDPSTIAARVNLQNSIDQNPNPGMQIPTWIEIQGGYTVSLTAIPTPLTLTGGATGDSAGTVTYTLGTVAPLRLGGGPYADEPNGAVAWRWVEGDSVPHLSVYDGAAWDIEGCRYQSSCTWTPPPGVNGRLEAGAWVEGQYAIVRSEYVRQAGGQCSALESRSVAGRLAPRSDCVDTSPDLEVSCDPQQPVRGTDVACTASVTQNTAFDVVREVASGDGFQIGRDVNHSYGPGEKHTWAGTAVAPTRVRFTVVIHDHGKDRQVSKTASFTPRGRTWDNFTFAKVTEIRYQVLPGKMTPYPLPNSLMGALAETGLNPGTMELASVAGGPNDSITYLAHRPELTAGGAFIYLHPALYPEHCGADKLCLHWSEDQNGKGSGTCTQADLPTLRAKIERHEGVTADSVSHWGLGNRLLAQDRPQDTLEQYYKWKANPDTFKTEVYDVYVSYISGSYRTAQNAFDDEDIPKIWGSFPCTFDFDPHDQ